MTTTKKRITGVEFPTPADYRHFRTLVAEAPSKCGCRLIPNAVEISDEKRFADILRLFKGREVDAGPIADIQLGSDGRITTR
jgi:hypothetical protein